WPTAHDGGAAEPGSWRGGLARSDSGGAGPGGMMGAARPRPDDGTIGSGSGSGPGRDHLPGAAPTASGTSPQDFVWPSSARPPGPGGGTRAQTSRWVTGEDSGTGREVGEFPDVPGSSAGSLPTLGSGESEQRPGGDPGWGGARSTTGPAGSGMPRRIAPTGSF